MDNVVEDRRAKYLSEANKLCDAVLTNSKSNFEGLYGKSLIFYHEGKIEESAKLLQKILDSEPEESHYKVRKLQEKLMELLKPKPPTAVIIMDEIQKEYPDSEIIKHYPASEIAVVNQLAPKPTPERTQDLIVTPKVHKEFFCVICSKSFSKMFGLSRHLLIHQGLKDYKCDECGRCFSQKSDLKRHQTVHEDFYEFECSFKECGKFFKTKKSLRCHAKTHDQNRGLNCDLCNRTFVTKRSFKIHTNVHFGYLPFSCDVCGKRFPMKAALRSHIITHSMEKPHVCAACDSTFKRKFDLKVHYKMVHHLHIAQLE